MKMNQPSEAALLRSVWVLVRLVREEYGDRRPLSEIGFLWGRASDADRKSLDEVEAWISDGQTIK